MDRFCYFANEQRCKGNNRYDAAKTTLPDRDTDFLGNPWKGLYLYIDKTEYVYRVTHSDSKSVFLSRPCRFGKSLLISMLQSYFEGRKELFEGLSIDKLETEWTRFRCCTLT